MITKEKLDEFKKADKLGLLFAWTGGVNNELCEHCKKHRGDIVISVCQDKDEAEDPVSGEITIIGTTCFKEIKKQLGLKLKITKE